MIVCNRTLPTRQPRALCLFYLARNSFQSSFRPAWSDEGPRGGDCPRPRIDLRSQGHPDRSMSLNNLAIRLSTRYKQLGAMDDLDEAIVLVRKALVLHPQGHPLRSSSLNGRADGLSTRYKQLGAMEDLDEAIVHATSAFGSPGRSSYRTRRTCSVSTFNSYMCFRLCLPLIFLLLEHGFVSLRISSIPRYFSHMKHLFDYSFDI